MNTKDTSDYLSGIKDIAEAYVLIREVRVFLKVGYDSYYPEIKIKIWHSNALPDSPFHFTLSHHVHTPLQAGPYYPSRSCAETEKQALSLAIDATTSFLKGAIQAGHSPSDEWLVANLDF